MNKNIIITYGFRKYRNPYLVDIKNINTNDIYITMDDLFTSLMLLMPGGGNHLKRVNIFFENNGQSDYLLQKERGYDTDRFHNLFIEEILINQKSELDSQISKINKDTTNYLFHSLSYFLKNHFPQLSVSATLNRRKENKTKTGGYKKYQNYQAGFLAKNTLLNDGYRNKDILKEKRSTSSEILANRFNHNFGSKDYPNRSGQDFISNSLYGHYDIGNREYTSNIFNAFLESDQRGFSRLFDMKEDIEERDRRCYKKPVTEQDKEMFEHGKVLTNCFTMAFIRKLCKLSIDWAEQEASKENSPIKKIIFYLEEHSPFNLAKMDNINSHNFHHKWRTSDFRDIGSSNRGFPITYSELKYAFELMDRKKDHHIELVPVNKFAYNKRVIDNL
ncbi:hypothetical protein [Xenorhabdus kozodoii]|uniref:Uncharacterized protein n=1 Tax=Xenorhabdus kozodoii TaxID=351676 RepID=A0A2D0L405_9GAMM|nr:hypothetical protein [Xenorhabdus kozodoii]PHM70411.1 hypothetical protein Xkoz_03123 [Xenorhabdus kozodoii]